MNCCIANYTYRMPLIVLLASDLHVAVV